jgi:hypothetical protein
MSRSPRMEYLRMTPDDQRCKYRCSPIREREDRFVSFYHTILVHSYVEREKANMPAVDVAHATTNIPSSIDFPWDMFLAKACWALGWSSQSSVFDPVKPPEDLPSSTASGRNAVFDLIKSLRQQHNENAHSLTWLNIQLLRLRYKHLQYVAAGKSLRA